MMTAGARPIPAGTGGDTFSVEVALGRKTWFMTFTLFLKNILQRACPQVLIENIVEIRSWSADGTKIGAGRPKKVRDPRLHLAIEDAG